MNTKSRIAGMKVDLIHVDSQLSPLYKSWMSKAMVVRNDARRSMKRVRGFAGNEGVKEIESSIKTDGVVYIMNVTLGTPPFSTFLIADTGSSFIWTQCEPCVECFHQHFPIFCTNESTSYHSVPYDAVSPCIDAPGWWENPDGGVCTYDALYNDGDKSKGVVSTELFTFSDSSSGEQEIHNFTFGCGFNQTGSHPETASGVAGLGGDELSLIKQVLKPPQKQVFTYCLLHPTRLDRSSRLFLGQDALFENVTFVSTPITSTYGGYYLHFNGVSVDNKKFNARTDKTRIAIDSGTPLTFLEPILYDLVKAYLQSQIPLEPILNDDTYDLCYQTNPGDTQKFPAIIIHLTGVVIRYPIQTFIQVESRYFCWTMKKLAEENGTQIFGSYMQYNFLIKYDLDKNTVGFKGDDCTKY